MSDCSTYYAITIDENGYILCNDGELRCGMVPYGTMRGCPKAYKTIGHTIRGIQKIQRKHKFAFRVIGLDKYTVIDAGRHVSRIIDSGTDNERFVSLTLDDVTVAKVSCEWTDCAGVVHTIPV